MRTRGKRERGEEQVKREGYLNYVESGNVLPQLFVYSSNALALFTSPPPPGA